MSAARPRANVRGGKVPHKITCGGCGNDVTAAKLPCTRCAVPHLSSERCDDISVNHHGGSVIVKFHNRWGVQWVWAETQYEEIYKLLCVDWLSGSTKCTLGNCGKCKKVKPPRACDPHACKAAERLILEHHNAKSAPKEPKPTDSFWNSHIVFKKGGLESEVAKVADEQDEINKPSSEDSTCQILTPATSTPTVASGANKVDPDSSPCINTTNGAPPVSQPGSCITDEFTESTDSILTPWESPNAHDDLDHRLIAFEKPADIPASKGGEQAQKIRLQSEVQKCRDAVAKDEKRITDASALMSQYAPPAQQPEMPASTDYAGSEAGRLKFVTEANAVSEKLLHDIVMAEMQVRRLKSAQATVGEAVAAAGRIQEKRDWMGLLESMMDSMSM